MSNPFKSGDEAKNKYMEKALHANEDALSQTKFTDLLNKDSSVYQDSNKPQEKSKIEIPEKPTVDPDGYPIISQIHTYKEDLTGIISDDKLSMSRIAMMNSNQEKSKEIKNPKSTQNKIYIIIGIVLIVLSIGIIGVIYALTNKNSEALEQKIPAKEKYLIYAEKKDGYNITKSTKTEIANHIKNNIQKFKEEDGILEIVPTIINENDSQEYRASLKILLEKVNARIPDELYRTLSDRFFLGLYSKKGVTNPFMIIYTSSYDIAYPSLLNWEGLMQDDFNWFTDTSNPKNGTVVDKLLFKDRIIVNKDIRSLEDSTGKVSFFYTFLDDKTILFARTTDTVRKVMDRIREAKFQ